MMSAQTLTTLPYLQGYWKFNNDYQDATANANTLTGSGTPTFVTDVPFSSPTTRLDIDQTSTTTGNTYTLTTSINEGATHRKTFTPEKDPQKSLAVLVASVGTGIWNLTVHDSFNNEIASKRMTAAPTTITVDSYSEANKDSATLMSSHPFGVQSYAQSFTSTSNQTLYSAKLYLAQKIFNTLTPKGTLKLRIYTHTGNYGSTSVPVDPYTNYLAESDLVDVGVLTASFALQEFMFLGSNKIQLQL